MKRLFLTLTFTVVMTSLCFSQIHEIGFFVGGSNYVGDVGRTNYIYPNKFAGGIIYKYNYNSRMAFRITYSYLPIKGDDTHATNPYRVQRSYIITNTIHELALGIEFNFFEYDLSTIGKSFTPYLLLEIAGFNYKSPEPSTVPSSLKLTRKNALAIPFGLGVKGRLYDNFSFAVEAKVRYTLKDDLDYTTAKIPVLNFGGVGNDWYMFTGISIIYTFGNFPCYVNPR